MMARCKLEPGCLLKFHAFIGPVLSGRPASAGSSGSEAVPDHLRNTVASSWWVLGCISLRPLCHMMLKVAPDPALGAAADCLVPVMNAGRAIVASTYEILEFYVRACKGRDMMPEARISSWSYQLQAGEGPRAGLENCLKLNEGPVHENLSL